MKKAFSFLELILVVSILVIVLTFFIPKKTTNKLDELVNRIVLQLQQTRYIALIDSKYSNSNQKWFKQRWTMKFFRCKKEIGGIYYSIYSDKNMSGHPSASESLKDPLTNKNIYSSNSCSNNKENSKYVLLTKNFQIQTVGISCNSTSSLGQISFGYDGKVYSKLSNIANASEMYEITDNCFLKFIDNSNNSKIIEVSPITGYIKKLD